MSLYGQLKWRVKVGCVEARRWLANEEFETSSDQFQVAPI